MYDINAVIAAGAQNAKPAAGLGASSVQQGRQSPAVEECRATFKNAMQAAQDKNAGAAQGGPGQNAAGKVSEPAPGHVPAIEAAPGTTEPDIGGGLAVYENEPVSVPDDEPRDIRALPDALIQLLMIAMKPVSDEIAEQNDIEAVKTLIDRLEPGDRLKLLSLLDEIVSKLSQAAEENGVQSAGLGDLLKRLAEAAGIRLQSAADGGENITALPLEVGADDSGQADVIFRRLIAMLSSGVREPDARSGAASETAPVTELKPDAYIKPDMDLKPVAEPKPAAADPLLAFKSRLAVIANEVKAAVMNAEPAVTPEADILAGKVIDAAPIAAAASGGGAESGNGKTDGGQKQADGGSGEAARHVSAAMPPADFKAAATARTGNTQPPPAPQPNAGNIIDQIVQNATLRNVQSNTQMEISLKPEFLGKVSIILTSTDEGVVATIKAATAEVRNALSANIGQLQTALRESGINMRDITITNSSMNPDFTRKDHDADQKWERDSVIRAARLGRMLSRPEEDAETPVPAVGTYDISRNMPYYSDAASVEFTA